MGMRSMFRRAMVAFAFLPIATVAQAENWTGWPNQIFSWQTLAFVEDIKLEFSDVSDNCVQNSAALEDKIKFQLYKAGFGVAKDRDLMYGMPNAAEMWVHLATIRRAEGDCIWSLTTDLKRFNAVPNSGKPTFVIEEAVWRNALLGDAGTTVDENFDEIATALVTALVNAANQHRSNPDVQMLLMKQR